MVAAKGIVRTPRVFDWVDLAVVGLLAALICALVAVAREWSGPLQQVPEIHLEARYLPLYALFSLSRGVMAYGVSFLFTMIWGYAMARAAGAERVMLPYPRAERHPDFLALNQKLHPLITQTVLPADPAPTLAVGIGRLPSNEIDEAVVLSQLALTFPHEQPLLILRTVVAWTRYAALFQDSSTRRVFQGLQRPAAVL